LLKCITLKVDLSKVVQQIRSCGYLGIITEWLQSVQSQNNQAVNDALNFLYLEIEDFEALRNSISTYESIDSIALAKQMQSHDNPQFRRISSLIYKKNKKYQDSVELSKRDKQYRDAIETAQESKSWDLVESLLRFFGEEGEKEFFTVCTYTCYEFIRPETVTELAWRFSLYDFAMPFWIQLTRDLTYRVEVVQKKNEEREKKEAEKTEKESNQALNPMFDDPMFGGGGSQYPMIMGGNTGMDPMAGMGGMGGIGGMPGFSNGQGMQNMGGMGGMGGSGGMGGANMNNMF